LTITSTVHCSMSSVNSRASLSFPRRKPLSMWGARMMTSHFLLSQK